MDPTHKKKPARSDAKSKKRKNDPKSNDDSISSSSCDKIAEKPKCPKVNVIDSRTELKKQAAGRTQKKNSVRSDAKRSSRKSSSKSNDVSRVSTSLGKDAKTPKQSNVSFTDTLPGSSSRTPIRTPRSSLSAVAGEKTPCSFYRVTKDEDGKPVFSKSLIKYFLTVDSPEMDDLKNKRWNTSFLHETPKPNREIRIFTEEEDNDPKYFENVPEIDSNLPDVPGSLHADVFKSMPINDSDEELKSVFKDITPVKGPNGRRKRKSTRISCYNGKPLPDESLTFDYSDLLNSDIDIEENHSDSKENIMDIKIEEA